MHALDDFNFMKACNELIVVVLTWLETSLKTIIKAYHENPDM